MPWRKNFCFFGDNLSMNGTQYGCMILIRNSWVASGWLLFGSNDQPPLLNKSIQGWSRCKPAASVRGLKKSPTLPSRLTIEMLRTSSLARSSVDSRAENVYSIFHSCMTDGKEERNTGLKVDGFGGRREASLSLTEMKGMKDGPENNAPGGNLDEREISQPSPCLWHPVNLYMTPLSRNTLQVSFKPGKPHGQTQKRAQVFEVSILHHVVSSLPQLYQDWASWGIFDRNPRQFSRILKLLRWQPLVTRARII